MEQIRNYIIAVMVIFVVIYGIDSILFRHLFWERLVANIGIVLLFIIIYLNITQDQNQESKSLKKSVKHK